MLEDKDPDKIPEPCRDDQVHRLADKNTGSGNGYPDVIIQAA